MGDTRVKVTLRNGRAGFLPECTEHGRLLLYPTTRGDLVTTVLLRHERYYPGCSRRVS